MIGTLITNFISPLPLPSQMRQSEVESPIIIFLFKGSPSVRDTRGWAAALVWTVSNLILAAKSRNYAGTDKSRKDLCQQPRLTFEDAVCLAQRVASYRSEDDPHRGKIFQKSSRFPCPMPAAGKYMLSESLLCYSANQQELNAVSSWKTMSQD